MKTFVPTALSNNDRKWYLIDAKDIVLWKIAVTAANLLTGKNKTDYVPHLDNWDNVIIINADKMKLTGKKLEDKIYYKHSWYIWHLKTTTAKEMIEKKPGQIIRTAIEWMITRNKLKKYRSLRLKIFIRTEHYHEAQTPTVITVKYKK